MNVSVPCRVFLHWVRRAPPGERLGDVDAAHACRAVEVGQGARDAQRAVIAARGEAHALGGIGKSLRPSASGAATSSKSVPSASAFERGPRRSARVAVEEASAFGKERYTGFDGTILGFHTFELSAPMRVVEQHFVFEPAHAAAAAMEHIARHAAKLRGRIAPVLSVEARND